MLRLDPPIPVTTPIGPGHAHFIRDYGTEWDDIWTVLITRGEHANEFWSFPNSVIRGDTNITMGRTDGEG